MFEIFLANQCKEMDRQSINDVGIPGIILMENAALSILKKIVDKGESFLILCGKGNNGGDALALSRHLLLVGKKVKVYIVSENEKYSDDFTTNFNILKKLIDKEELVFIKSEDDINQNVINDLKGYDVVIDGIFGIGLSRDLTGAFRRIIECVNLYGRFIVSIDIPSGLNCDLGIERGIAIHANITYTFEVIKQGFLNYKAINYVGKLEVLKIGIPEYIKKNISGKSYILEEQDYKRLFPKRKVYGHKGNYGRALVVAGREGFTGAAFIATECTVRAGAGLTTLLCDKEVQDALSGKFIEAMTKTWTDNVMEFIEGASSIAFGPGIGTDDKSAKKLEQVINKSKCPIVIDADGITLLGENKVLLSNLKGRAVMTPHPGEMARFLGITIDEVESDRINIAQKVANEYGIVVVLKGYNTVISDGKDTYINPTGNSKMASGGMGDALTGIINAFLSQNVKLGQAALIGAYIHGYIADKLGKQAYIINARDIISELPREINSIVN